MGLSTPPHLNSGTAALGDVATADGNSGVTYEPPAMVPGGGGGGGPNKVVSQIVTGTAPQASTEQTADSLASSRRPALPRRCSSKFRAGYSPPAGALPTIMPWRCKGGGVDILVPAGLRARNVVGHISLIYLDSPASDAELAYGLFWGAVQGSLGASATSPMVMILEEVD